MTVPVLDPNNAPIWLNVIIWMGVFWQYILVGFLPAFYIAITKLFGFPLLQRWSQEVVIILFPSKVKFGKIVQQYDPYFKYGKGVYWAENPLQPDPTVIIPPEVQTRLYKIKDRYEMIQAKQTKTENDNKEIARLLKLNTKLTKKAMEITPNNQIHIFTHAVNQPVYRMERRQTKLDELLNNDPKPKKLGKHGIWLMNYPRLHFHRHFQLIVDPSGTLYKIIPVKEKQQFGIGFWHSLGIVLQKEVETEEETEMSSGGGKAKQLVSTTVTTNTVIQMIQQVGDNQNFSASQAYRILKRRANIEENFTSWITGGLSKQVFMMIIVLAGAVASIAMIFMFLHNGGSTSMPPGLK